MSVYTQINVEHPDYRLGPPMVAGSFDDPAADMDLSPIVLPGFGLATVDFQFVPEHGVREYRNGRQEVVGERRYRAQVSIEYPHLAAAPWNALQSRLRLPTILMSPYSRWNVVKQRHEPWPAFFPVLLDGPLPFGLSDPLPLANTRLTFTGTRVYEEDHLRRLLTPDLGIYPLPALGGYAIVSEDADEITLAAWGSASWEDSQVEIEIDGTPYTVDLTTLGPEGLLASISRLPGAGIGETRDAENHHLILETMDEPSS